MATIRTGTRDDAARLAELFERQWRLQQSYDTTGTPMPDSMDHVLARLQREHGVVLVAEGASDIVGYVDIGVVGRGRGGSDGRRIRLLPRRVGPVVAPRRYGFVFDLYVVDEDRRHGVGESLLTAALGWLSDQGVDEVEARIAAANEVAQSFFACHGFGEVATLRRKVL